MTNPPPAPHTIERLSEAGFVSLAMLAGMQLDQLGMVDAAVALPGQGHYLLLDGLCSGVGRYLSSVLVDQSAGTFSPIRCQQPPSLTLAYSQQGRRLLHAPVSLQHSIQYL